MIHFSQNDLKNSLCPRLPGRLTCSKLWKRLMFLKMLRLKTVSTAAHLARLKLTNYQISLIICRHMSVMEATNACVAGGFIHWMTVLRFPSWQCSDSSLLPVLVLQVDPVEVVLLYPLQVWLVEMVCFQAPNLQFPQETGNSCTVNFK